MMKLHHIGIATKDIKESIIKLEKIYDIMHISEMVFDERQNAYLCMLTLIDQSRLELVQGAVVEKMVKRRLFLYHTCYETEDVEHAIAKFITQGAVLISEPKSAILFCNRQVAFLMTEMGIVELLESEES